MSGMCPLGLKHSNLSVSIWCLFCTPVLTSFFFACRSLWRSQLSRSADVTWPTAPRSPGRSASNTGPAPASAAATSQHAVSTLLQQPESTSQYQYEPVARQLPQLAISHQVKTLPSHLAHPLCRASRRDPPKARSHNRAAGGQF